MRPVLTSVCLVILAASLLLGQTAALSGTVRDTSKAVVPGASVTVVKLDTGVSYKTASNNSGVYSLPSLPPGKYEMHVDKEGFQPLVREGIIISTGNQVQLDVVLTVGNTKQSIVVSGTAEIINSADGSVGQVINDKEIVQLPLNGRDFTQLASLTPGVSSVSSLGSGGASSVSVNGSRSTKTEFIMDGVTTTGPINGGTGVLPSIDALQEFKVQASAFSAEYGRSAALINVSLKSGTNQFHGALFDFVRNDKFDAKNFFATANAPLKRNQFGGTFGGPIKKDNLFFFVNYEGVRLRQGTTYKDTVATNAQRLGNFSGGKTIYDPDTTALNASGKYARTPFPGNAIPADRFASQSAYFLDYFPAANTSDGAYYVFSPSTTKDQDQGTIRVDKQVGSKGTLSGRYTIVNKNTFTPSTFPSLGGSSLDARFQNAALSYTYVWTPRIVSVTRLGYNREYTLGVPPGYGTNWTSKAGIAGFDITGAQYPKFPNLNVSGYSGLSGTGYPVNNTNNVYEIVQNFMISLGRHNIKTGIDLRQQRNSNYYGGDNAGTFSFTGSYTNNPLSTTGTGSGFADYLLGLPGSATRAYRAIVYGNYISNYHFFVQDDWKVSSSLTLNVGLRYEYNPWPNKLYNQNTSFDLALGKIVVASPMNLSSDFAKTIYNLNPDLYVTTEEAGLPKTISYNNKKDFAPRFGLAWRPLAGDDLVVRAGYGIFYDLANANGYTLNNPPFGSFTETISNNTPVYNRTLADYFFGEPPTVYAAPSVYSFPVRNHMPMEQEWNLLVQRMMPGQIAAEIGYVGKRGTHLERYIYFNAPSPGAGSVQARRPYPEVGAGVAFEHGGSSTYHALQAKVEKRFSHGVSFLASYTWSKSIDDCSTDIGCISQNPADYRPERGLSTFDIAHQVVASYLYELPIGRGKPLLRSLGTNWDRLIGGWQLAGITTLHSGLPFTPTISIDNANTGVTPQRPNRLGSGSLSNPTIAKWFNPSDFEIANTYTFGNSGRGILRGPGFANFDMAMLKSIPVSEGKALEFRAEAFNIFNHPNFGLPATTINTTSAGKITSAYDPRILQFALKLQF